MATDKRRSSRIRVQLSCGLQKKTLLFFRGPRESAGLLDISKTGAGITATSTLTVGDPVVLLLRTKTLSPVVEMPGKVVWSRRRSQGGKLFMQAGIQFSVLSQEAGALIARMALGHAVAG